MLTPGREVTVFFPGDRQPFESFGPCFLAGKRPPAFETVEFLGQHRTGRAAVRRQCPDCPGVYGMIDADGRLIYVGKARRLARRMASYLYAVDPDTKAHRIIERTKRIVWEPAPTEFAALVRELELIRRWQPQFNVAGRPGRRRRAYVCIGRDPAPYVHLAARPAAPAAAVFGPVAGGGPAREAVRRLNDYFMLRDCPQNVPLGYRDQLPLFVLDRSAACLRFEIGTCLGPCVEASTRRTYFAHVRRARAFLEGTDARPLAELERRMNDAAAGRQFELAAALRDTWRDLSWLAEQLARLREVRGTYRFVYPQPGYHGRAMWFVIRGGHLIASVREPSTRAAAARTAALVERSFAGQDASGDVDLLLLVAAWFRKYPQELECTLRPDVARQRCLDRRKWRRSAAFRQAG